MTGATAADAGRRGIHLGRFVNIMSAHIESWYLRAIDRDGSKPVQELSSAEKQQ